MTAVARAIYDAAVAWDKSLTGFFTFDSSRMDGTDPLAPGAQIVPAFSGLYDNLSRPRDANWPTRVERVTWFRGRSDTFEQVVAGEATVDVHDPKGLLNPKNAASPIAAFIGDPMRPFRLRALYSIAPAGSDPQMWPSPTTNLCPNGGLETNTTGWFAIDSGAASMTMTRDSTQAKYGLASLKLVNTLAGQDDYANMTITGLTIGQAYTFSAWVNCTAFTAGAIGNRSILIYDGASGIFDTSLTGVTAGWVRKSVTYTVTATSVTIRLYSPQGTVYWDGIQVEQQSSATPYVHTDGAAASRTGGRQGLFYGFVRDLTYQPKGLRGGTAQLHCVDLFLKLGVNLTIGSLAATNTGAVTAAILDAIGWTDPAYRSIATGDPIATWAEATGGAVDGLTLIGNVLVTEFGLFYIGGDGTAVYEDRNARGKKRTPSYTFTDVMRAIGPGSSADRVKNRATFTKTGSTPQVFTNAASADPNRGYGLRALPEVVSPYLADDAAALARAQYVVGVKKNPVGPLYNFTIDNRTPALLLALLDLEISDFIQASEAGTGTNVKAYIERLEHTLQLAGQPRHSASYLLSEQKNVSFVFDGSLMDGGDVLTL